MRSWDDSQKDPIKATQRATAAVKEKLILLINLNTRVQGSSNHGQASARQKLAKFYFSHISFCLELNRSKVAKEGTLVVYRLSK